MRFIKKYQKQIYWILVILSIVLGVIGVETKHQWIFMIGWSVAGLLILTGIVSKIYYHFKKK